MRISPQVIGIVRLALTAGCVWALAQWWWSRPDLGGFAFNWPGLAWALAITPVILILRAAKWRACLHGLPVLPSLGESLRSYVGALPLAVITPGRAGELARPLYFKAPALRGLRHLETSGRLLLDNWTDTLAVLLCALPGCFWLWGPWGLVGGLTLFAVLACMGLWLDLTRHLLKALTRVNALAVMGALALRLLPPSEAAGSRLLLQGLFWGVLAYGFESLQFLCLLSGLTSVGLAPEVWLPLFGGLALVHLANSFQVTVAGIGPREAMTVWLLAKLGLGQGALMAAAFLQMALVFLLPAGVGLGIKPTVDEDAPSRDTLPVAETQGAG